MSPDEPVPPGRPQEATGPPAGRRARGSLETEIIEILHRSEVALSPAQVRARLPGSSLLSYSAVVTTLTRLHAKGLVTRRRHGRAYRYTAGDAASVAARRMTRLLDDQADHRLALTHFLAALSPGDEALLRALITESDAPPHDGSGAEDEPPAARDRRQPRA
ncbi:BlaI/MecI/CopY family transcriptional regulator [Parafrankia elaeagni]|uniref:BlaI/MecI/CopY family transcriptional regulator n=1 Tax=Parafrankia elaeagni TaxID=222534 RepID=UPI00035C74AA|nr:BlaI/MecI/CopY family transcriptional regulator [Parafrankia elaeagni]